MRGDSLRDLYAKILAVCGLGAIALAGAAVDYWPGPAFVPRVDTLVSALLPPAADPVALRWTPPAPAPRRARVAPVVPDPAAARAVPAMPIVEPLPLASVADLLPVSPVPVIVAPPEAAWTSTDDASGGVVDAEPPADPILVFASIHPVGGAAIEFAPPKPGFIAGAWRKTRGSLVNAGAATGASIVDAMKAVGGAVRKVWIF